MEKTTFLEEILEIEVPWYVEGADLDRESGTFSIRLDFEAGGTFACGACGLGECKAHDTYWKRWRHLDFLGYRTFLHAPRPRVKWPPVRGQECAGALGAAAERVHARPGVFRWTVWPRICP